MLETSIPEPLPFLSDSISDAMQDSDVLVIVDGIPRVHQDIVHRMNRLILHMLGDLEPGDHTKILMPIDEQQMTMG
jgi:hypothetical protein